MRSRITNLYKKAGIFTCPHPAHRRFNSGVSPYHVFKVAGCWPKGCVEFVWRCRQFEKGRKCPRGYKHVGRACSSCKYYHEIKNCFFPSSTMEGSKLEGFIKDMREYEGWLQGMIGKVVRFSGIVQDIKPHLSMRKGRRGRSVRMHGFLATFARGYLGNDLFDDRIYLKITEGFLKKTHLAPGDEIECDVLFSEERGRIILHNPRRFELARNGGRQSITPSRALVGRATGKIIDGSIESCRDCHYCCLVDIEDDSRIKPSRHRRFYCLRGISDPEYCPVRLESLITDNTPKKTVQRF